MAENMWNDFSGRLSRNSNALIGLGSGLLQGRNISQGLAAGGQGFMQGAQADDAFATQQKAEQERQAQLNQTVEWARSNFPDQLANVPEHLVGDMAIDLWKQQFTKGADDTDPATVREWEYFSNLGPEQQAQYLRMKRANPYLDIGTGFVQPNPVDPGGTSGPVIPKHGDVPVGFQNTGDGIAPMAGSEPDIERRNAVLQAQQAAAGADRVADNVIDTIDTAVSQAGAGETGLVGAVMGNVPGTQAYDLRATVTTIKANLGFAELQAMRDASPTGGALGQVAIQELEALQSTIANLDPNQSREVLIANLARIKTHLERLKAVRAAALEQRMANMGAAAPASGGDVDAILQEYGVP